VGFAILTVLHIAIYALAAVGALALAERGARLPAVTRKRRHDALMGRIAQLETATGLGVVYARGWVDEQRKITRESHLCMTGRWWCYGCGEWHAANGNGFHKLCGRAAKGEGR
jgi:hypothetical protein